MANHLYRNDLPDGLDLGPVVADVQQVGERVVARRQRRQAVNL